MDGSARVGGADVVYINLDRARDRRAFMERQGELRGVRLERLSAVEDKDIGGDLYARLSGQWERPMTRIEVAVFLSHKALWERAAASPRGLVILEDDAVFSPRLAAFANDPPAGFDLVNLECFERRKFMGRRAGTGARSTITPVVRDKAGAAAYYLSPSGAEKLLALADRRVAPADAFMFAVVPLETAQAEPALAMQAHLLAARGIDPGIRTRTSIHQPRTRLGPEPANLRFHARRAATQFRLSAFHLRRLYDLDFRKPGFDEGEFRDILPIRFEDPPSSGGQERQRDS